MAWSKVSSATLSGTNSTTATSWNAGNLGAAVSASDRLVAVFTLYTSTQNMTGVSDSLSNTWYALDTSQSGNVRQEIWTTVSSAGTPSSVTAAFTGNITYKAIACATYRDLDATADTTVLEGTPLTAVASSSGPADSGTTSWTTSTANGLVVGAYSDNGASATITAGDGFVQDAGLDPSSVLTAVLETKDSGAVGSNAQATATLSGSAAWIMTVLVIKPLATTSILPHAQHYYRMLRG